MNPYIAEFLGTMLLIFIILSTNGNSIAVGITVTLIVMMLGNVSGGHVNPAVTIAMSLIGKIPMKEIVPYVLSQIAGGLVALEVHKRVM
tara:strand:+ start:309 stop:575 length:267 start_codon:yes stop_codon:yes gene_type:complete